LLVSSNFLTWVTSSISSSCESSKKSTSDILNYFSNYAVYETQSHVLRIFQNFFNISLDHSTNHLQHSWQSVSDLQ
jgi:hypothetical protein